MEKRLILAIVLSFLILMGYQFFVVKPRAERAVQPEQTPMEPVIRQAIQPEEETVVKKPEEEIAETRPAEEDEKTSPVSGQYEEDIVVDTPLYQAVWSNRGGILKSWALKLHKNAEKEDLDLVPLRAQETGRYPFSVLLEDAALSDRLNSALFQADGTRWNLVSGQSEEIRFAFADGESLRAEKIFRFTGGTYIVETEIRVWIGGQEVTPAVVWGPGISNRSEAELKQTFSARTGSAVFTGGKVNRMDERKYKPEQSAYNFVDWAAYEDNYFTALFVLPPQQGQAVFLREAIDEAPAFFLAVTEPRQAFIGPKDFDALKAFGHDSKRILNFGFFGSIAEILLVAVKFFHNLVPNWGIAIIVLTFIIKIIFFPLTYSSTKSMARMAELQPKVKAIRAKYKKAKTDIAQRRQMNEEMMKLYKEHGVNPAGGCLPMLIQIPVFWGFFRMLVVSVEFRHSPFIFWLKDLSVRDPYYITPILMGITQFISQKMTPSAADPSQARMMLIMPVIMTVFFMNFQSGLVLYWLTSNLLQIGQQAIMNKMMARKKREKDGKRKGK